MVKKIFALALALCMLFSLVSVSASAEEALETVPKSIESKSINLDFDANTQDVTWEAGKTYTPSTSKGGLVAGMYIEANCDYIVENDLEDPQHGNYLSFAGGQRTGGKETLFGFYSFSRDKVQIKFDLKVTEGTSLSYRPYLNKDKDKVAYTIANDSFTVGAADGKLAASIEPDTWYTYCFTYDELNDIRTVVLTDMDGNELYDSGEGSFLGSTNTYLSYFRIFAKAGGNVSIDNIELTEWAMVPEFVSITDGEAGDPIDYNTDTVVLNMSKAVLLEKEKITVTRDIDGSNVLVKDAVADESDTKKIVLTLDTPLQSASNYTVTFSEDMQMNMNSLSKVVEIGEAISGQFTTSPRDADMTWAEITPSAPTNSAGKRKAAASRQLPIRQYENY